ncbi:MAG: hypothetical protein K6E54_10000 [Bacteroidaceae bacterium]|nr:hypothetical protein [Bacteroidaceae bacterium]
MRTYFQKTISTSQFSLPIFAILGAIIWLLLPAKDSFAWNEIEYGIWSYVPQYVQTGYTGAILGMVLTAFTVYSMVEFSNTMVLLNTNSNMISCLLILLMSFSLCLHTFQPVHIIIFANILSYYALFSSYQNENPVLSFITHLMIAISSLIFPKLILLSIITWFIQLQLNSLTPRAFIASLLAIMVPYWFFFVFAVCNDRIDIFTNFIDQLIEYNPTGITTISKQQLLVGFYIALTLIAGIIDYWMTNNDDRIRQRIIYNVLVFHSIIIVILAFLLPQCFNVFLGLLALDASILGGRFWVVTNNQFSHYFFIIMGLIGLIILALTCNM